jgi:hypothetical protein
MQEPHDWGAPYAILEGPDGIAVGLMSPISPDKKTEPRKYDGAAPKRPAWKKRSDAPTGSVSSVPYTPDLVGIFRIFLKSVFRFIKINAAWKGRLAGASEPT